MLPSADGSPFKLGPEHREIVSIYTPEVLKILDRLEENDHDDARVFLYVTEALGYDISVKSVLQSGPQLRRIFKNIDMMVQRHPELKGGAPYIIRGMMMLNAPPPLRNVKKARESFESARAIDPKNPRNLYFCGVAAFLEKDLTRAYDYFSEALRISEENGGRVRSCGGMTSSSSLSSSVPGTSKSSLMAEEPVDAYLLDQCHHGIKISQDGRK